MTTKNKAYLSIVIFFSSGVLLFVFLIQPVYKDIQEGSRELISKKQDLASLESKIKNIEDFRKNYKEIKENLEKIRGFFIKSKAPINFISFLEESSLTSQCPIEISPSTIKTDRDSPWPYIIFQIESVCSFPNFLKFFEKLESSPYLLETKNLNINKLTERDLKSKEFEGVSPEDVKTSFTMKVFAE